VSSTSSIEAPCHEAAGTARPQACPLASESPVRRSYLCFPRWSQPIWTLLTGKPLRQERPLWTPSPALGVLLTVAAIVGATGALLLLLSSSTPGQQAAGLLATLALAPLLAGAWRRIQVVYGHHAIHGTLVPRQPAANALLARLLTIFALAQNEKAYEREHRDHHRRAVFTTLKDADALLLFELGIRAGLSRRALHRALLRTLFSPQLHGRLLLARLQSQLQRPAAWRALAVAWAGVVLVGLPLLFGWLPVLLAVWLPMTLLYQVIAVLQFATEHVWLQSDQPAPNATEVVERSHGRFCGEAVPGHGGPPASAAAWLGWWTRTLLVHLPVRTCVLVGDLPAHDWHHLYSAVGHDAGSWPTAIFERQRAIDSGHSAGMEGRELWGIAQMLGHVFEAMSRVPAATSTASTVAHPCIQPVKES
jgi:hypothetical protein